MTRPNKTLWRLCGAMRRCWRAAILSALSALLAAQVARAEEPLRVFAAASLADALDAAFEAYRADTGRRVVGVYAASGALARQIDAGAPADLYVSANPEWADWLEARDALSAPPTPLAGNRLVIASATPRAGTHDPQILLNAERVAVADLLAAPAGRYAQQALQTLGLYDRIAPRLVQATDARAAAVWVARGEAPFGVIYATDARRAGLAIIVDIPQTAHAPIVYVVASPHGARAEAMELRAFLLGPDGQRILAEYGFTPPPRVEGAPEQP